MSGGRVMAEICLMLHLRDYSGKTNDRINSIFNNAVFPYNIYGYDVLFKTTINSTSMRGPYSASEITISFITELPSEIDVDNNDIFYADKSNVTCSELENCQGKELYKHDCLDEDFEAQLEIFCLSIVYAIILVDSSIDLGTARFSILLNQKQAFKDKRYIDNHIYEEIYDETQIVPRVSLEIAQTWDWLVKNGIRFATKPTCPVVSLLYYLFNREYHEVLLYSVIGLEALYVDNNRRASKSLMLQNRINHVFPSVTKEQIKQIYNVRSSISHGSGDISSSIVWLDLINSNKEYEELAILSSSILIESIRMLVANDATSFVFKEDVNITYSFE